ncbi:copper transporter [Nakamurella lactea]|uniref:copper transporter n=1 Tax=Nakamurella lactea TaxID=459515 RepID=UPI0004920DD1|nr:copper transporter [Nakamurella lactea]
MISMRSHIVSIAAVFLALALGIVLGATKVQSPILVGQQSNLTQITDQRDQLQQQTDDLTKQVTAGEKFADDIAPLAVRGTLPKASVVLISTVDADPGDRDAILGLLSRSGATVTSQIQLTTDFTDPNRSADLQALLAKSLPSGATIPEVASSGTMAGAVLGSVLLTDKNGKATAKADEATAALSALSTGGFITASGTQSPGRLVLVLTGGAATGGSEADRATVVADMATQLKQAAGGVVVVGRSGSDGATGAVGAVRSDASRSGAVSTVDDAQASTGRLAAVLGLVEQNGGGVGQYGVGDGAQAPIPALAVN